MTNEELVYLYQNGDKQALEKLIEKNTGIIYKLVNKFYVGKTNSIDREDLEQEGAIGLIIAANKYDFNNPNKAQFITYAVHWIYQKINRYVTQKNTNEEISLNTPTGEDGDIELLDCIDGEDYSFENVDEKLYKQQLRKDLEDVMNSCNTLKEREILKLHYGWDNNKCMTLNDIAQIFSISGERVRQQKSQAMRKIRRTMWGRLKAKELYEQMKNKSSYSVSDLIESMNFAERYL